MAFKMLWIALLLMSSHLMCSLAMWNRANMSSTRTRLFGNLSIAALNLKGPPSPKRPCAPRLPFYEFRVTRNCFWAGFLSKSVSSGAILSKIVQKHAGIYSSIIRLLFPGIILWLRAGQTNFFALTSSNMFPAKWYLAVEDSARLCRRKMIF